MLVHPENVFEIMRALHRVLLDRPLREKMKERSYKQAAKFSWEKSVRRILEMYHEVLAAKGNPDTPNLITKTVGGRNTKPKAWRNSAPFALPQPALKCGLLNQRLAGRCNREFVQLGGDAVAVGIGWAAARRLRRIATLC